MQSYIEVKRVDLWSLFKVGFLIYAVLGLFFGLVYGFFILVAGSINSALFGDQFPRMGMVGGVLGLALIPLVAFLYGVVGSVFLTIGGFIFNAIAGLAGGVRFETSVMEIHPPAVTGTDTMNTEPAG